MEQVHPPFQADEVDTLRAFLNYYRATILRQCEGLDADQLKVVLAPSTMTLGGMLKHLTGVEDWWFGQVFLDRPADKLWGEIDWDADPDWDWHSAAHDTPDQLRTQFQDAVDRSNTILDTAASWSELSVKTSRRTGERISLRWIVVHLIEEYARHAGHADLIRESIDGAVDL